MSAKHVASMALVAFVVVALVGRITVLKTLVGFQASS